MQSPPLPPPVAAPKSQVAIYMALALLVVIACATATLAGIGVVAYLRHEIATSEARQNANEVMRRNYWNADVLNTLADMEAKGVTPEDLAAYQNKHLNNPPRDYVAK